MKDLLTYIAKSLVENPDAVSVTEVQKEDGLVLELRVAPDDMGKVIGKHGRIAKEIRTVIKAAALRDNVKVSVDILD
ncbi:MAG: KH domain-containing protein [Oscillospiraceae bacterium]|nr:KH domain-containing protein [Oscillospiraceae bacterium]